MLLIGFILLIAGGLFIFKDIISDGLAPIPGNDYPGIEREDIQDKQVDGTPALEVVAGGLWVPWEIGFLPDGSYLVTEFRGNLTHITKDPNEPSGTKLTRIPLKNIAQSGDAGLTGLLVHPDFAENQRIYLFMTNADKINQLSFVTSYKLVNGTLEDPIAIVENIPAGPENNGGRIALGPDNLIYITTGDSRQKHLAQDLGSLAGKILRVDPNGKAPDTNPFKSMVYSYGHRNPLGITWSDSGIMWELETGRTGDGAGLDEINRVFQSNNYGWPEIEGDQTRADMTAPIKHSGPSQAWHPTSAQYANGSLFFGGLNGDGLYEAVLSKDESKVEQIKLHFKQDFGRIRTVRLGPDGYLYLLTSNKDGEGKPFEDDDRVIRVHPSVFK